MNDRNDYEVVSLFYNRWWLCKDKKGYFIAWDLGNGCWDDEIYYGNNISDLVELVVSWLE